MANQPIGEKAIQIADELHDLFKKIKELFGISIESQISLADKNGKTFIRLEIPNSSAISPTLSPLIIGNPQYIERTVIEGLLKKVLA